MNISNPLKGKSRTVQALIIIGIILLLVAVVYAAYTMTSNTVTVVVNPQATLTLTSSSTSIVLGDQVTLTATCSDASFTGSVAFTANGNSIGSSTASAGVATLTWTPSTAASYNVVASATHP